MAKQYSCYQQQILTKSFGLVGGWGDVKHLYIITYLKQATQLVTSFKQNIEEALKQTYAHICFKTYRLTLLYHFMTLLPTFDLVCEVTDFNYHRKVLYSFTELFTIQSVEVPC